jgi:hypothetical protein
MGAGASARAFWVSAPRILALGLQQGREAVVRHPAEASGAWDGGEVVWLDGEDGEEG